MEMSIIAEEDIEAGEDLTPPLSPLSASSHTDFLESHCSTCSELMLALPTPRPSPPFFRLFGLLTNRQNLISDPQVAALLGEMKMKKGDAEDDELVESVICLVLTNAVEVCDGRGQKIGIAVYGPEFSWINHSCSPNATYRFLMESHHSPSFYQSKMRIVPCSSNGESGVFSDFDSAKGYNYGPKLIVRSIKRIKKGEEVTVAYTDLLQPKDIRQSELWSKYRFVCSCTQCSASPSCYVDHVLQEISVLNLDSSSAVFDVFFSREKVSDKLTDYVDEIISEYLSDGNPRNCCNKVESLLIHGLIDEHGETTEGKSKLNFRLHPLHHLALNAYTTLASAYKVCADDLLVLNTESEVGHCMEVLNMSKNSAAYSLFLAAATYHLYCFEPSLIASVANFWISAGESLLSLVRRLSWGSSGKWKLSAADLSSLVEDNFSKCSCLGKYEKYSPQSEGPSADLESISNELHVCISSFSQKVWRFLIQHCHYLKMFKDLNFGELGKSSTIWDSEPSLIGYQIDSNYTNDRADLEIEEYQDELQMDVFHLGVHCLILGGILARMCFGQDSHLISHIQRILTL